MAWYRVLVVVSSCVLVGCAPRTRSQLVPAHTSAEDLYDCVRYELAREGFTIVDADRGAGFVRAQEAFRDWKGDPLTREIFASALVPPGEGRPHLQISSNRHAHEHADRIVSACAPATAP